MNFKSIKNGILAFVIILLLMPIGHALMILIEELLEADKFIGAFIVGLLGLVLLILSLTRFQKKSVATISGLLAGILVWTGWVEFSFVWIANKLSIPGAMENGEVVTKPEYLIMPSSLGLLSTLMIFFLFNKSRCQFFNWFQRLFGLKKLIRVKSKDDRPISIITFIETIMILWFFYIVLLLVYDPDIAGDNHPMTFIVAFGSLIWSIYLFLNLIKINQLDYAIRYAIPTVIIFWNFIEVMGRWDLFKEIWVHPFEHWIEILIITLLFIGFLGYYVVESRKARMKLSTEQSVESGDNS
ncbi:MAG: hypothetical protein ABFS32_04890 [Bacteroidota bacterium]